MFIFCFLIVYVKAFFSISVLKLVIVPCLFIMDILPFWLSSCPINLIHFFTITITLISSYHNWFHFYCCIHNRYFDHFRYFDHVNFRRKKNYKNWREILKFMKKSPAPSHLRFRGTIHGTYGKHVLYCAVCVYWVLCVLLCSVV